MPIARTKLRPDWGHPGNHIKVALVGMPNVGKSTTFNALCDMQVSAENYPFCTIEHTLGRVEVPDPKYRSLVQKYDPKSAMPAYLGVVDAAGLTAGASHGEGLGISFLSHVGDCDALYHVVRGFEDGEIVHVEGSVDPIRDIGIVRAELAARDLEVVQSCIQKATTEHERQKKNVAKAQEVETLHQVREALQAGDDLLHMHWNRQSADVIDTMALLSAKPVVYVCNLSERDYIRKKNKHLGTLAEWVEAQPRSEIFIPFSAEFEVKLGGLPREERAAYCNEVGAKSAFPRMIKSAYKALQMQHFYTVPSHGGPDEVQSWSIPQGTKAKQAAGVVHSDFEKKFVRATIMKHADLEACGSEAEVKAKGLLQEKGKEYEMVEGDIVHFVHNQKK